MKQRSLRAVYKCNRGYASYKSDIDTKHGQHKFAVLNNWLCTDLWLAEMLFELVSALNSQQKITHLPYVEGVTVFYRILDI